MKNPLAADCAFTNVYRGYFTNFKQTAREDTLIFETLLATATANICESSSGPIERVTQVKSGKSIGDLDNPDTTNRSSDCR